MSDEKQEDGNPVSGVWYPESAIRYLESGIRNRAFHRDSQTFGEGLNNRFQCIR